MNATQKKSIVFFPSCFSEAKTAKTRRQNQETETQILCVNNVVMYRASSSAKPEASVIAPVAHTLDTHIQRHNENNGINVDVVAWMPCTYSTRILIINNICNLAEVSVGAGVQDRPAVSIPKWKWRWCIGMTVGIAMHWFLVVCVCVCVFEGADISEFQPAV